MITKWSSLTPKDPWVSLSELVEQWDEDSLSSPWDLTSDVVVLVDEAQKTYDDYVLWNCLLMELCLWMEMVAGFYTRKLLIPEDDK